MPQKPGNLTERLRAFNAEVMAFVAGCSEQDWKKPCAAEEWSVGVTARHIGAGHYAAVGLARMMVQGEKLPDLTMAQLTEMANEHARQHADCSREEVLDILRRDGAALADFAAGLSGEELQRSAHLALVDGKMTVAQFLEAVILHSGAEHFSHMKAAVAS
jgi:hypothetical protein